MSRLKAAVSSYMNKRFTTDHMTASEVISIIIPVFVDYAFIVFFGILNTSMISSSGTDALSAVGMVDSLNMFLQQVFVSLASGGTVVVAQYMGAKNQDMVSRASSQAVSLVAIIGLVIGGLVIIFNQGTLNLLFGGAEENVMNLAQLYLIGCCISYPMLAIINSVCGALRGVGKAKASLALSMISNGGMLLCNVIFIQVLQLGVQGLVYSIVISRIIGSVSAIFYLLKIDKLLNFNIKKAFQFESVIVRKLLLLGIPFAMENLFFTGGKLLTQTFIVGMGTASIGINTICNSLMTLIQLPAQGLSLATVTIVGQSIGRGEIADARKYTMSLIKLGSLTSWIVSIIVVAAFPLWVIMYHIEQGLVSSVFYIVLILAIGQPIIWPRAFIVPSALRAAGDAKYTSIAALLSMWIVRVVLGYIVGVVFGLGIVGVWAAMVFEWIVRAVLFYTRFRGDAWTRHSIVD